MWNYDRRQQMNWVDFDIDPAKQSQGLSKVRDSFLQQLPSCYCLTYILRIFDASTFSNKNNWGIHLNLYSFTHNNNNNTLIYGYLTQLHFSRAHGSQNEVHEADL